MKQQTSLNERKISRSEEAELVSQISPPYRRLDVLANILQGRSAAAAICFDGRVFKVAINEREESELSLKLAKYLKEVATVDYGVPGFISKLNEKKAKLLKYIDAQYDGENTDGWISRSKSNLLRVEGSIHAYRIQENPSLRNLFRGNEYRAEVAFPEEMINAISRGFEYVPAINGMHAELKLAQELLYKNLNKLRSGEKFYIATSKKCCMNCEAAIGAINEVFSQEASQTEGLRYSSSSNPGRNLSIATKESLVGLPGSQEMFPARIPSFMVPGDSRLEESLRASIVEKFLDNLGRSPNTNLEELFYENRGRRHLNDLRHTFSVSPTSRLRRTEQSIPTSFTEKLSMESGAKIAAIAKRDHDTTSLVSEMNLESTTIGRSLRMGEDASTEIKDAEETSSNKETKSSSSNRKKKAAKANKKKKAAKVKKQTNISVETEDDGVEIEIEELIKQNSTDQPIIIFYERPNDSTTVDTVKSLMGNFEASGIGTLAPYDSEVEPTSDLKAHYRGMFTQLTEAAKKTKTPEHRKLVKELMQVYMGNYQLIVKAEEEGLSISNISSIDKKSKGESGSTNFETASMEEKKRAICHDTEMMERYEQSLQNSDTNAVGKRLAGKLSAICRETEKGVVAIVEYNKAKALEEALKKSLCSNVTSFFIFRINELDRLEESNLIVNMLKYNPDFVNSTTMPNATIIDATGISKEDLNSRISECIRPVTIEPIVEYEPGQEKAGEWEERTSRSRSPVDEKSEGRY